MLNKVNAWLQLQERKLRQLGEASEVFLPKALPNGYIQWSPISHSAYQPTSTNGVNLKEGAARLRLVTLDAALLTNSTDAQKSNVFFLIRP